MENYKKFQEALCKELNEILWGELGLPIVPVCMSLNIQKENGDIDSKSETISFAREEKKKGKKKEIKTFGNYPVFELANIYKVYEKWTDIEKVAKLILLCAGFPDEYTAQVPEAIDPCESRIFYTAVNKDKYADMLKRVPHRMVHDLAVVYHIKYDERAGKDGFSTIISNEMADLLGKKEEDLFKLAQVNTKYLLKPKVKSIKDFFYENYKLCEMSDAEATKRAEEHAKKLPEAHIVSDESGYSNQSIYGSSFILENEFLQNLSMEYDDDLIILPVSSYAFVVIKSADMRIKDADTMASIIRDTFIPEEEQLSNSVYYYNQMKNELLLVSTGRSIHDITAFLSRIRNNDN